jgi:hypothetical protein
MPSKGTGPLGQGEEKSRDSTSVGGQQLGNLLELEREGVRGRAVVSVKGVRGRV